MSASQQDDFRRIIRAGFGFQPTVLDARTHHSKSQELPILCAFGGDSNIELGNISHNYHFYFMGLRLKKPIPAPFLYPISHLFRDYPLSGHCDTAYPALTAFPKAYGNVERIDRLGFTFNYPLEGALAIRYLDAVSKLPLDRILNMVLYETNYGLIDAIDFNAVGADGEAELAKILDLGFEKFAYYDFDVTNAAPMFSKINVDWYHSRGATPSAVHFILKDHLPPLLVPHSDIYYQSTPEMMACGLGAEVPLICLADQKYTEDGRWDLRNKAHPLYLQKSPLTARSWTIGTNNGLDTAMTAYFLNHILQPCIEDLALPAPPTCKADEIGGDPTT